jgi:N-acetylneuraminic acid mutarotase
MILTFLVIQLMISLVLTSHAPGDISWSKGPDIPLPRGGYYAAWHNGGLLLAGGTYWKDKKKHWTDKVSFYDPKLNKWTELKPLPRPLAYGSMVDADGSLYLIGGSDEKNIYRDVYRLDGENWVRISELPRPLVYTNSVSVGSRIYVVGGGGSLSDATQAANSMWMFETRKGDWSKLESIPSPQRVYHTTAAFGTKIFVFGGSTLKPGEDLKNIDSVVAFDTVSGSWKEMKGAPVAARAWWAYPVGAYIYLFGGYSDQFLDRVYRYDPIKDDYSLISTLPLPLADTQFFYSDGVFYGATGEDKMVSRFSGTLIGRLAAEKSKN